MISSLGWHAIATGCFTGTSVGDSDMKVCPGSNSKYLPTVENTLTISSQNNDLYNYVFIRKKT